MRTFLLLPILVAGLLAGCARPPVSAQTPLAGPVAAANEAPPQKSASDVPGRTKPAPIKSTGLPPERADDAPRLDTTCRTDTDCAIKDVGSCCGVNPACVNKDAPVDPAAVQAECARRGSASACAFKPIESCSCVAGHCKANLMMTH